MYQPGGKQQNNDSDNDEGFVVNTIEIKQKDRPKLVLDSKSRPNDYQPRYLQSTTLLRKEPHALITAYPHFSPDDHNITPKQSRRNQSQPISKIQQSQFPNKNYQLVYQRSHRKYESDILFTENNIDLTSAVSYSADNYSVLKPWDNRISAQDIVFQSRFESGNLLYAYHSLASPNHYVLFLQNDTNTKGYNKWFYFAVKNKKRNTNYTFSIVNFRKSLTFVKQGMKVTRFSVKEQEARGNGWSRCSKTQMYRSKIGEQTDLYPYNQHYTLTFQVNFDYENDTNFFSLLPPYSYSKLTHFLTESQKTCSKEGDIKFDIKSISYSLLNTQVPYITISALEPSKRNIVILARQHPGQVWSSFFAQSLIKELIRDSFPQKEWLLKNYTFRIFPMVNVDGVIHGNFRCDLSGMDLNRCWKQPNKLLHPHLIAIKQQIQRLSSEDEIVSCFDLHSHSKQYNIFAYCCRTDNHSRIIPLLISQMTSLFYFPYCTFGISKYKQSTARAVIYEITRAPDVLTFQSSFFATNNPFKVISPSIFIAFSQAFIKALKHYYSRDNQYLQAEQGLPKAMAEVASLRSKNREKYALKQESGSDSQPDIDQIALNQKIGKILPKCPIVEEVFGLKQEKTKLQALSKTKKDFSKRQKKEKIQEQRPIKVARSTISEEPIISQKLDKSPIVIERKRIRSNNTANNFLDRITKRKDASYQARNRRKQEIQELTKQTIRQQYHESLELANNRQTLTRFLASEFRSTFRQKHHLRYELQEVQEKKEEEFPMLCILSDSKREAHLQKLRRIHPAPSQREKAIIRYQPTLVVNKKLDTMQRLRQRQKKSSDLVSSLWKDTLGYDQDGPITHIFYAGP